MNEASCNPNNQRKRRKLDRSENTDQITTGSLDTESDVPTTKLSAAIAWDWQTYNKSTHDQFCEQCREWFAGWENKLAAMDERENYRYLKATAHHLSKKSFLDAIKSRCPFCLLIYDKHIRYNPQLKLGNMREDTEIPFTTMSIEETVQLQRDKFVDVYVSLPGENSRESIPEHFTFWQWNSAFPGMCLVPGFSCIIWMVKTNILQELGRRSFHFEEVLLEIRPV